MSVRRYVLRGVAGDGKLTTQTVEAPTRVDAMRQAAQSGLAVLDLKEAPAASAARVRKVSGEHAILILQQLAVMIGAGIQLLDAIETLASSLPDPQTAASLRSAAQALRRGDRFGDALATALPIYPQYVYGLIRAGEASGQLARVLEEAAKQLDFERRVSRNIVNALTYPAFLVVSGVASVSFLLYAVVPRFAAMLESARSQPDGFSRFVLEAGVAFNANAPTILAVAVGLIIALVLASQTVAARKLLSQVAHATPGLRALLLARQRTAWARVAALSLDAGLGILDAARLAADTLPEGALRHRVNDAIPALRAGRGVDEAFREAGVATAIDASLLRAGQRSGALARMLHTIANRHEDDLANTLKRLTVIVEPVAIAVVAVMVGGIVLALASALVGVYESIG